MVQLNSFVKILCGFVVTEFVESSSAPTHIGLTQRKGLTQQNSSTFHIEINGECYTRL